MSLFRRDAPITSAWGVIGWWETRRLAYNLIVGGAGILAAIVMAIVGLAALIFYGMDFGVAGSPLFAVIAVLIYGIAANVCYTCGWVAELVVRRAWPEEADRFATTTFSLGLFLSVLLTLTPAIIVGVAGIFKLVNHYLGALHR